MAGTPTTPQPRPPRFRLYIDESGDHAYCKLDHVAHRYLALLGVWFRQPDEKGVFGILYNDDTRRRFDDALLKLVTDAAFKLVCVVIDKRRIRTAIPVRFTRTTTALRRCWTAIAGI